MTKGADSIIEGLLSNSSKNSECFKSTKKYVDEYARDGLRTLYLSQKNIDEDDFNKWNKAKEKAKLATVHREEEIAKVDALIEVDLELIGSTAIEDRL